MEGDSDENEVSQWNRLEQSWRALQAFQKSHTGRLGTDLQLEHRLSIDEGIIEMNINGFDHDESDISSGDEGTDFIIPELPRGQVLKLTIVSTWGDPYYVGLNGIEIFSDQGTHVTPSSITCSGPADAIPDCSKIENLVDGNYRTRDDTRMWLAAFDPTNPLIVTLTFPQSFTIAMIRIWNYNKSRIHSNRGVRLSEMQLDDQIIFRGEISQAVGCYMDSDVLGDTILFTTEDSILEEISENDHYIIDEEEDKAQQANTTNNNPNVRPSTGERPTSRKLTRPSTGDEKVSDTLKHMYSVEGSAIVIKGTMVTLELVSNWGYEGHIGLTGIQLLDRKGKPINLTRDKITCNQGTNVERLINHKRLTTDVNEMFLSSFTGSGGPVSISLNVAGVTGLQGMTLWNYNGGGDQSYCGVRSVNLLVDGELVLDDIILRKAPGNLHYDFAQDITFGESQLGLKDWGLDALTGFVLQIQLLSTWGDEFYAGLNGIELLDEEGKPERISMKNLAAYPESVNVLPSVKDDPRNSGKLIDNINDTNDAQNMWLAPLIPNQMNRVYLIFDNMKCMHGLKLYNYRKTPERGVRDIIILLDDLIVYSGQIPMSTKEKTGCLPLYFNNPTNNSF